MGNPRLRDVEVFPIRDDLFALRDPLRYTDKILLVPAAVLAVIALFDGNHSLFEIQEELARRLGDASAESNVREIVRSLDSNGFLESEDFQRRRRDIDNRFAASDVRAAAHAGNGYEAEPEALREQLDGYFKGIPLPESSGHNLRGMIAPHIDMRRGGSCYAHGYSEVRRLCRAHTVVLLGISHVQMRNRYAFTEKDFATPLGTLTTDKAAVRELAGACGFDPFEDEAAHRHEHSLEFQAVFLRHALPDREELRIVPILCGPLLPDFSLGGTPTSDPQVGSFVTGLSRLLVERGEDVTLIAGVDLCHIGRRFGDREPFTPELLSAAENGDREMLENVLDLDAKGFIAFIQKEKDRRKVCGVPAIYAMLSALKRASGSVRGTSRLLSYEMSVDREGESAVGFASVAFYG